MNLRLKFFYNRQKVINMLFLTSDFFFFFFFFFFIINSFLDTDELMFSNKFKFVVKMYIYDRN